MVPLTQKIKICCHFTANRQQNEQRCFTVGQALREATGRTEFGRFRNIPDTALNSRLRITDCDENVKMHLCSLMDVKGIFHGLIPLSWGVFAVFTSRQYPSLPTTDQLPIRSPVFRGESTRHEELVFPAEPRFPGGPGCLKFQRS